MQELLARLTNQYITSSNSSVNTTFTDNAKDFPLGRPFYADFRYVLRVALRFCVCLRRLY